MVLQQVDLIQVRRTGEHFKKTLRETFDQIPPSAQSIAGLARWTGVNKSTCQRLVQALTKSHDGIDVIITLPGPSGLNQLKSRFSKLISDEDCVRNFAQLVTEYENLIFDYATSQTELKRILLQSQEKGSASKDIYTRKLRKVAFETNREICGESVDRYLGIHVSRVNRKDPNFLDELVVASRQGVELSRNARPFVQAFAGNQKSISVNQPQIVNDNNVNRGSYDSGAYLLQDFSTPNIEDSFAGTAGVSSNLVYNHTLPPIENGKFDISIMLLDYQTQSNPMLHNHKVICQSLMQRSPARQIFMLTLLEKQLDKASSIQTGCYPSSMKAQETGHNPEDLWSEKFPDSPEIKLFDPVNESISGKAAIPEADRMLSQVFEMIDDDPANYMGYYINIDYPLWLTSHRIYFDFS